MQSSDSRNEAVPQAINEQIEIGQLYAINGGVFRAKYDEESERLELWAFNGQNGYEVTRVGFVVGGSGELYDRLYDYETNEYYLIDFGRHCSTSLTKVLQEDLKLYE